ncbi:MAG TPA: antitoxin Xre/MbcA/ParS toxin-binding domain-containing protein [Candidatus Cybelea sp.]|jgi:putative toxin-antitoxin system antitoxin component (TIGR02293 family)|nr:antitoxin Xre/MbcA/ParS toxin-binding domain-containing protein [Candidatus Cybelea sp.]
MNVFDDVVKVLGGHKTFGGDVLTCDLDLNKLIHDGVPIAAFHYMVESLGQREGTIMDGLAISRVTLEERRTAGRLDVDESERVIRLARIVALGELAFGSTQTVGRWLLKPNVALNGAIPLSLLHADLGGRQVEAALGRALLGGYS